MGCKRGLKVWVKNEQADFLKQSISKYVPDAVIYPIGSRVNDNLGGGDIDILVIAEKDFTGVDKADDLLNIREIRNQIAHEYVEPDVKSLFRDVLHYVPQLKNVINNVNAYYKKLTATKPERK